MSKKIHNQDARNIQNNSEGFRISKVLKAIESAANGAVGLEEEDEASTPGSADQGVSAEKTEIPDLNQDNSDDSEAQAASKEAADTSNASEVPDTPDIPNTPNEEKRVTDKADKTANQVFREQTLDFASLSSELTIEEVQEEAQILEEENLSTESPLDKYVRRHREEVENAKNSLGSDSANATAAASADKTSENSAAEQSKSSNSQTVPASGKGLDAVAVIEDDEVEAKATISTEAPVALEGEIIDTSIFPAPTLSEIYESQKAEEKKFDTVSFDASAPDPELTPVNSTASMSSTLRRSDRIPSVSKTHPAAETAASAADINSDSEEKREINRKPVIIGLLALAVLAAAGYAGVQIFNKNQTDTRVQASKAADKISVFNKDYNTFFTDDSHNTLKNGNFDMISKLGDDLNAISTSDSQFTTLQTKYNNLSTDISAIKSVNAIFDKPAIIDGKFDETVVAKDGATIPNVSSKNTTLNDLLKKAIELAKSQQANKTSSSALASTPSTSANSNPTGDSSSDTPSSSGSTTESSTPVTENPAEAGTVYSQNPTGNTPDSSGSRVPVQSVDPNSAAFQWPAGVLDEVIGTMQSRGYISGSNYILTPVAVDTAGDGWYNIYRPDGSYLFSINCKTGFWAGAGGKHPNLPASF